MPKAGAPAPEVDDVEMPGAAGEHLFSGRT
jgi:hypothetical protein